MSIACPPLPPKRAGRQGPWLHRSYPASALLRPCPTPRRARPPCRGRRSCELHPPGPPFLHCGLPWLTCRAHYPGGPNRCQCRLLPGPCGLPRISGGSASAISLSRPAQAGLRVYGLPACSPGFPRTLSRGFRPADYPTAPLVSFHAYRQLHRWAPSSHRVSAPKRRTEKSGIIAVAAFPPVS